MSDLHSAARCGRLVVVAAVASILAGSQMLAAQAQVEDGRINRIEFRHDRQRQCQP